MQEKVLTSIYLHIPFCRHRCGYCDFNTFAGVEYWIGDYVHALLKEIAFIRASTQRRQKIHTIYLGGGTPSLLAASQVMDILSQIRQIFDLFPDAEITLEANPGSLSLEYLRDLHQVGVNRLSLGMQSAHPDDLRLLERQHDTFQVIESVKNARLAGFENLSIDLIFGIPGQDLSRWQDSLRLAVDLKPEHISLYSLTIEDGTPLKQLNRKGLLTPLEEDLPADMYESAVDFLGKSGFEQYEISNWARRSAAGDLLASRHNLQYWLNRPYIGLGAGAHGCWMGYRLANVSSIPTYIQAMERSISADCPQTPATAEMIKVELQQEMMETMMLGLRLTGSGVSRQYFSSRFGLEMDDVFSTEIEDLVKNGLLEWGGPLDDQHLTLTERGRLLGNQVFYRFV